MPLGGESVKTSCVGPYLNCRVASGRVCIFEVGEDSDELCNLFAPSKIGASGWAQRHRAHPEYHTKLKSAGLIKSYGMFGGFHLRGQVAERKWAMVLVQSDVSNKFVNICPGLVRKTT